MRQIKWVDPISIFIFIHCRFLSFVITTVVITMLYIDKNKIPKLILYLIKRILSELKIYLIVLIVHFMQVASQGYSDQAKAAIAKCTGQFPSGNVS